MKIIITMNKKQWVKKTINFTDLTETLHLEKEDIGKTVMDVAIAPFERRFELLSKNKDWFRNVKMMGNFYPDKYIEYEDYCDVEIEVSYEIKTMNDLKEFLEERGLGLRIAGGDYDEVEIEL